MPVNLCLLVDRQSVDRDELCIGVVRDYRGVNQDLRVVPIEAHLGGDV